MIHDIESAPYADAEDVPEDFRNFTRIATLICLIIGFIVGAIGGSILYASSGAGTVAIWAGGILVVGLIRLAYLIGAAK